MLTIQRQQFSLRHENVIKFLLQSPRFAVEVLIWSTYFCVASVGFRSRVKETHQVFSHYFETGNPKAVISQKEESVFKILFQNPSYTVGVLTWSIALTKITTSSVNISILRIQKGNSTNIQNINQDSATKSKFYIRGPNIVNRLSCCLYLPFEYVLQNISSFSLLISILTIHKQQITQNKMKM